MHSPTMPSQDVRLSHAGIESKRIESFSALEALREALYKYTTTTTTTTKHIHILVP